MKTTELIAKFRVGMRERGIKYPVHAIINELRHPRHALTPHIRKALVGILGIFRSRERDGEAWAGDCLQFIYDLRVSPMTYDFASYLAAAEIERRIRGLEAINVIFVTGSNSEIRNELPDYDSVIDRDARLFRFQSVILPILNFLPSVRGYARCGNREMVETLSAACPEENLYPANYRNYLPCQPSKRDIFEHARSQTTIWPMYSATSKAKKYVNEFLTREGQGRLPIVITLRNYDYLPLRNSHNEEWIAFADQLDQDVFIPIFVHDTETIMRPPSADFSNHVSCEAASWNLEIRVALFEQAWLNLAVMHGPMELCWYIQSARYVVFLNVGTAPQTDLATFAENKQSVGKDLEFSMPYQHIAWCEDNLTNIRTEFENMREIIGLAPNPGLP